MSRTDAWESITLGELVARTGGSIQTGPFGSQLHASDYVPVGIPSVMPANIGDNVIDADGIARITEEDAARLARHRLRPGDIVYSRRGDVERRALVRSENAGWLCGTGCLRVRFGAEAPVDAQFVSHLLGAPWTREWITQHAVGATMLNLNTSILSAVPLMVPSVEEQRAIAEVLSALDDKIEANRKLAATADDLAAAMLAPYEPKVPLGTLSRQVKESLNPKHLQDQVVAHYSLPTFDRGSGPERIAASSIKSNKYRVQNPSVLVSKLNPRFPRIWNVSDIGDKPALASTEFVVLEPTRCSTNVLWAMAQHPRFARSLQSLVAGTSGSHQRVRPAEMLDTLVPDPAEVPDAITARVDAVVERSVAASSECRTLALLRDTLLPKLMSGQLQVREAMEVAVL